MLPSVTSGLKISVQSVKPATPTVHLCEQKRLNCVFFVPIHNCCTRSGDCLILLIQTGNARKEQLLPPTTFHTFEKCKGGGIETQSKLMTALNARR